MSMPLRSPDNRFTYADYVTWPENERWELIDGRPYDMTPAPTTVHQRIVINFAYLLKERAPRSCSVFVAQTDVVFSEFDVVQPDVLMVCDKTKITHANIQGAPELIVEVLSPSTGLKDKREKKSLYERNGVLEYVVVHPELHYVERHALGEGGLYGREELLGPAESLRLNIVQDEIVIELSEIFEGSV